MPELTANTSYAEIDGSFQICDEPTPLMENTHENYLALRSNRQVKDSPIRLTELMAKNVSYAADENGEYVDWVEIYNSSSYSISLQGYCLSDSEDNLRKWTFPNISIDAGQYMIVYCSGYDRRDASKPLHTNFKLATEKEGIYLTDSSGYIIDKVEYDLLKADQSLSRQSDEVWVTTKAPTPGMANTFASAALISGQFAAQNTSGIFINEIMASTSKTNVNNSSYDWVELRNATNQNVDISGFGLSDDPGKPRKWQFPEGTVVPAGSLMGVYLSGLDDKVGAYLHTSFSLSATEGETLVLSDPTGKILDRCPMGQQYTDMSYGRMGTSLDRHHGVHVRIGQSPLGCLYQIVQARYILCLERTQTVHFRNIAERRPGHRGQLVFIERHLGTVAFGLTQQIGCDLYKIQLEFSSCSSGCLGHLFPVLAVRLDVHAPAVIGKAAHGAADDDEAWTAVDFFTFQVSAESLL